MGNGIKYNQAGLKANLQMANSRLNLMKNKRLNQISQSKCEIADLLQNGKEEMAMVKVESIINNENYITAIEVLTMFCAQLNERVFQITAANKCPDDLRVAIETIIWASCKIDSKELLEVRQNLGAKFGFEFCRAASENKDGFVNSVVRDKLVNIVPDEESKVVKIQEIASEKRIDFVFKHHIRLEIQNKNLPPQNLNTSIVNGFPSQSEFPPPQAGYPSNSSAGYPPNGFPPSGGFQTSGGFPNSAPGGYPPSAPGGYPPNTHDFHGNYPPPQNKLDENQFPSPPSGLPPPRNAARDELPSVPTTGFRDFDVDSLEERFKKLK
jgi:vacuolar protein sorting-associated protein IST1